MGEYGCFVVRRLKSCRNERRGRGREECREGPVCGYAEKCCIAKEGGKERGRKEGGDG